MAAAPMLGAHAEALVALETRPEEVRSLRPSTLLIHGSRSFPLEAICFEHFGALRPQTERLRIEGARHALQLQRPDEVNAALRSFLDGNGTPVPARP